MRRKRFFTRHPIALQVEIKGGDGWQSVQTSDVSRRGLFMRMNFPPPINRVMQIRVDLPDKSRLEAMVQVRRVIPPEDAGPLGPGAGVEFFSMADANWRMWDDFVLSLAGESRAAPQDQALPDWKRSESGPVPPPPIVDDPDVPIDTTPRFSPTKGSGKNVPTFVVADGEPHPDVQAIAIAPSVSASHQSAPSSAPAAPQPARHDSTTPGGAMPTVRLTVRLRSVEELPMLVKVIEKRKRLPLRTRLQCTAGQPAQVAIVHPGSDVEHHVPAIVKRAAPADDASLWSVLVSFDLSADDLRALHEFVDAASSVTARVPVEVHEGELDRLAADAATRPHDPHALVAWADGLVIYARDPLAAIDRYLEALQRDPSFVRAHRGLALAHALLGHETEAYAFATSAFDLASGKAPS